MKIEFAAWMLQLINYDNGNLGLGLVNTIANLLKVYCDNSVVVFFSKNDNLSFSSLRTRFRNRESLIRVLN